MRLSGLARQMAAQIRLGHRRHRVPAHHRVAIDAISVAPKAGEELAEGGVAPQLRPADDQRHDVTAEDGRPMSIARPMLPTMGLESKVEQTL